MRNHIPQISYEENISKELYSARELNKNPQIFSILQAGKTDRIIASLRMFGFEDTDNDMIDFLSARGYLDKIAGKEQKILALQSLGFVLDSSSIALLCKDSKEKIVQSIARFEEWREKLLLLQEIGFCFNGESFSSILELPELIIDKIIKYKDSLLLLKPFGVTFDLADYDYFNVEVGIIQTLAGMHETLRLQGMLGVQISLKNLCSLTVSERRRIKNSQTIPVIEGIQSRLTQIIESEKSRKKDDILSFNKIYNSKNKYNEDLFEKRKPKKEIISYIDTIPHSNPAFLDALDEHVFDSALENIDLISELLQMLGFASIEIKSFLELSYLFDKPETIQHILSLLKGGFTIGFNNLVNRYDLFQRLDSEMVRYGFVLKNIHGENFDDMVLVYQITSNTEAIAEILSQEEKYRKLISLYKKYFSDEEILFTIGIHQVFQYSIVPILNASNFDELEGVLTGFKDKIFHAENIAFVMKITEGIPGNFTKFMKAYLNYNFSFEFILFLQEQKVSDICEFLSNVSQDNALLMKHRKHCNELAVMCKTFGMPVSEEFGKLTYRENIKSLVSGIKPCPIITLPLIFQKLQDTGLASGKITKDNIAEIGAIMNNDFDQEISGYRELEKITLNNDIDTYKKVVRALGEYIYSDGIDKELIFSNLCTIFSKIFSSDFLWSISSNFGQKSCKYLLSRKVRLQDIERAYNSFPGILTYNIPDDVRYKFCLDYAIENDDYSYLGQNIETMKFLEESGYLLKLVTDGMDREGIFQILTEILKFTGGYITISMVKGYISEGRSLEELLQERLEAKKRVLSPDAITELNDAVYETIFLAYRPAGFTIETIKKNIENGNVPDLTHHLNGIRHNPAGYDMEFFTRSYALKGKQETKIVEGIDQVLQWDKVLLNLDASGELGNTGPSEYGLFKNINLKLFFTSSTNLFHRNKDSGVTEINTGIFNILRNIYALNNDSRIQAYKYHFNDGNFSYERLAELKEIFSVVTKDSFGLIIGLEIDSLDQETKKALWQQIGKVKDKNLRAKYQEIDAKVIPLSEKLIEIFMWRFLLYAKLVRGYLSTEMKKFKEVKGKEASIKAIVSKNIGSFFAKAGAGLCTSEDYGMWKEERHIHLNMIDESKGEIIGNIMLYFEPGRDYLIARGFNPTTVTESSYDVHHMVDEMIRVVKEIALANGYVDENGEALVYVPPTTYFHALSNREKVRKRMYYIIDKNAFKENAQIRNARFSAKTEGNQVYDTLYRI